MKLTKRQVKAMLDTLKINKSDRQSLTNLIVQDGLGFAMGKGYYLIRYDLSVDTLNGIIDYKDLEVWYKLASSKDVLTSEKLVSMIRQVKDTESLPPLNLNKLFNNNNSSSVDYISYNPKLMQVIHRVYDEKHITLNFSGKYSPIIITSEEHKLITSVLMPVRINKDDKWKVR